MIFLDANIFLRYLTVPQTKEDVVMNEQSTKLFDEVSKSSINVTTSEATLVEVVYALTNANQYGGKRSDAADALRTLLQPFSFRLATKSIVIRALEIWTIERRLSFPDALAAAYSENLQFELATFDARLRKFPGVLPYSFADLN